MLGPERSAEFYNIGSTLQSTNTSQYINIVTASTSYKPLALSATSNTTAWGLEGDTIITTTGSSFGRRKFTLMAPSMDAALFDNNLLRVWS